MDNLTGPLVDQAPVVGQETNILDQTTNPNMEVQPTVFDPPTAQTGMGFTGSLAQGYVDPNTTSKSSGSDQIVQPQTSNTYYGELATPQTGFATPTQNGLATPDNSNGLINLQTDYTDRTNTADRRRGELIDSVAGTAQSTQSQVIAMGNNFKATDTGKSTGQESKPLGNPNVGQYKENQAIPTPQQSDPSFAPSIGAAQSLLQNKSANLEPTLQIQLGEYSTAFTPTGELIPNGIDANGIQTIRGIDANGNLGIAKVGPQGKIIPQGVINLNQMQQKISSIPQGFMG